MGKRGYLSESAAKTFWDAMEESHHYCAADKSATTEGGCHVNMDQIRRGMFPASS